MAEQRIATRVDKQIAITLVVMDAPDEPALKEQVFSCETRDISITGLGLYTERQFPKNTSIQLEIVHDDPSSIFILKGQVIWSQFDPETDKFRTGIHFTQPPEDQAAWRNAVLFTVVG